MIKSEFTALPASMIAEVLWPLIGGKLESVPAPKVPMSPGWDMRLNRKGGKYIWASECDLNTIQFYYSRTQDTSDPAWAEKNKKDGDSLGFWMRWRAAFPTAIWTGTRGKKGDPSVTAKAPANKPAEYVWEPKGGSSIPRTNTTSSGGGGYVDEPYGSGTDDDIPFIIQDCLSQTERWLCV